MKKIKIENRFIYFKSSNLIFEICFTLNMFGKHWYEKIWNFHGVYVLFIIIIIIMLLFASNSYV